MNATNNVLYGDDTDGDGVFDVLYAQSYYERIDFVCSPTSATPYTDRLAGFGDGTSNYGMGFDATNNVLYMIDDDNREIVSVQ